ncbi:glycosyltransferase [Lactococcus garvieae]|nr:glycosyltransferase [Lactococcus garvieae]
MNITICLVAYAQKFTETESFASLVKLSGAIKKKLNVIVFDNGAIDYSEIKLSPLFHSLTYLYNLDPKERGTRIAYETSLSLSKDEWLMLLDDDTLLTESYMLTLFSELEGEERESDIVAYCAKIYDGTTQISPTASETLDMLLYPREAGVYHQDISGISSTLTLNKSFLEQIGGFTKEFPLDYLDHWLFSKIISSHKKVKVLQCKLSHHLSVQDLSSLSEERFHSIFSSEYRFYKAYKPDLLCQLKRKYVKMILEGLLKRDSGIRWKYLIKLMLQVKKTNPRLREEFHRFD